MSKEPNPVKSVRPELPFERSLNMSAAHGFESWLIMVLGAGIVGGSSLGLSLGTLFTPPPSVAGSRSPDPPPALM